MEELFGIDSHCFDGGRVVALTGELDAYTCQGIAEEMVGPPGSLIVVDLSRLTFIDSSGIGALCEAKRRVINDGGDLVVVQPSPWVSRVLEIMGLHAWVTEWDPDWSEESAATQATEPSHSAFISSSSRHAPARCRGRQA